MDSRERLAAASRGGETDRIPWFVWSGDTEAQPAIDFIAQWHPDAVVVGAPSDLATLVGAHPEVAVLVEVGNPFGVALQEGVDLNEEFEKGPALGSAAFDDFFLRTESALTAAMESGADGVLYRLFGADPMLSTPMQFGGFYLERERELLGSMADARFNVLYVEGGEGLYLDVVSDLQAHAFGWNEARSLIPAVDVREMRKGALACGLDAEDPQKLFRSIGHSGLILSGYVEDLAAFDGTNVVSASQSLAGAVR
ncbi:MAG: hypothetical protein M3R13_02355 [Armatimonadota bacterium]|nr:hypothetical protein [Armatimonadota bacterium]